MSPAAEHNEWLGLVPTSGPFLSVPVLLRAFPQGLDARDPALTAELRLAYAEWHDAPGNPVLHRAWTRWVLTRLLGFPEDLLAEGQALPPGLEAAFPEHGETLRPTLAILPPGEGPRRPALLVQVLPAGQGLEKPLAGAMWKATPAARMGDLLRVTDFPLGLVTNGEQWTLVSRVGENTGRADWFADVWLQEPLTLRAFTSLLGVGRTFGQAEDQRLPALLRASEGEQQEVTGRLGAQVREAVAVLIQAFDRLDADSGRTLLAGVEEKTLYEAALAVMMRLVFLFSAEERGLLLLGDPLYDQHYAISPLGAQLRERADLQGEEVLERFADAWCRLLTVFRAVHGGILHERLRLPAYGGTLFDPDRFPFLEGRPAGTRWSETPARPLRVDNRVVLHLLEALQFLQVKIPGSAEKIRRRLSFQSLDIEQIGHVYERLLDHTARRAGGVVLGLLGTGGRDPDARLEHLETLRAEGGESALLEELTDKTGRSESALRNALLGHSATGSRPGRRKGTLRPVTEATPPTAMELFPPTVVDGRLLAACGHDSALAARVTPFAGLLREDTFGRPAVVLPGSLHVTAGTDRKLTGTHYTPRALTEPIVKHTLEPLVFHGPAEGLPREDWRIKTPREILALKVCDLAMGSGAFLVEACRFLGLHLVRAWETVERDARPGTFVTTPEGDLATGDPAERLLPADPAERLAIARRCVADRCLYGVDINPMAVDIAKLSLWLITVQREQPFTFLDHSLKSGDSLLGITDLRQLENFSLRPDGQPILESFNLFRYTQKAAELRRQLEAFGSTSIVQVHEKERLLAEAETNTVRLRAAADFLLAAELTNPGERGWEGVRGIAASHMQAAWPEPLGEMQRRAAEALNGRRPFHWALEFPEICGEAEGVPGGFAAFVGNPPFQGGQKITGTLGTDYRDFLVARLADGQRGSADICAYFFLRAHSLLRPDSGIAGLIATNTISQGDTREVGLDQLAARGAIFPRAVPSRPWPGEAALEIAHVWLRRGEWKGEAILDDQSVVSITPFLTVPATVRGKPHRLMANAGKSFQGSIVLGMGFVLTPEAVGSLIAKDERNRDVLVPYLNGEDLNSRPDQSPSRWVIDFSDWPLDRSATGSWRDGSDEERKAWIRSGIVPHDYAGHTASDYPDCLDLVTLTVRPERLKNPDEGARKYWWRYLRPRSELYAAISSLEHITAISLVTHHVAFGIVDAHHVYAHRLAVFPISDYGSFSVMQSDVHEPWARAYSSSLETRINYSPSDCFETFPFPANLSSLHSIGARYHAHRQNLMLSRNEGLTKTYNRFHSDGETAADVVKFRELHIEMNRAVVDAYGWCDFVLNLDFYKTKQGLRFTLSEADRREVLDRLLLLNHSIYRKEVELGLHDKKVKKLGTKRRAVSTISAPLEMVTEFRFEDSSNPSLTPLISPAQDPMLPDSSRIPITIQNLYAYNLVRALLAAGGRDGLTWPRLRDAFVLATRPALLQQFASVEDAGLASAWATRWNEAATPSMLVPTLRALGGKNLEVKASPDGPQFSLKQSKKPKFTPDVSYDAWIALRVASSFAADTPPPLPESVEWIAAAREIALAI